MNNLWILAQNETQREGTELGQPPADQQQQQGGEAVQQQDGGQPVDQQGQGQPQQPTWMSYLPLIIIVVLMWIWLIRGPKKKQQKHQQMVQNLQKNDRIQTIGGIIGTVVDVRDNDVVIKIDESNNTKMRDAKQAIGTVISDESAK